MKYEFEVSDQVLQDEPELAQYMQCLQLMLNRMLVSHFKYGAMSNKYPDSAHAVDSVAKRLQMYTETGNTENCLDAANFCIIEHVFPSHTDAHFRAQSAQESPGIIWNV
jgi:hypothetical protein